jgi:hypothetical protein
MNFNLNKLNEDELKLVSLLSQCDNNTDKYTALLFFKFGFTLTKSELAFVLKKSQQTIDRRIKEGINIPRYIRSSDSEKASYIFPIAEVSEFLTKTIYVKC